MAALASLLVKDDFSRGLLLGFAVAAGIAVATTATIVMSGSGAVSMGAWAEAWTADELKRLGEHGYRVIHHAGLGYGDIDHFVVGPGGVFVLETKWSATDWAPDGRDPFVVRAVQQVERQRDTVTRWLPKDFPPAEAVLVLWGAAATAVRNRKGGAARPSERTVVISGSALEQWMLRRGRAALTSGQVQTAYDLMAAQVGKRDLVEAAAPRSISAMVTSAYLALLAFSATTTAVALLGTRFAPWVSGLVAAVLCVMGGRAAGRTARWQWPLAAAAIGAALWASFIVIVYAAAVLA